MTRTRIMIVVLFLVALGAGLAVGWVSHRPPKPPSREDGSWLSRVLNLTPAQQQQMAKIWENIGRSGAQQEADRRRALLKQRDDAIRSLIPPDKLADYEKVLETYSRQMAELSEQRRKAFEAAVEKTKAILDPAQRAKYEQILAQRYEGRRPPGGPGRGHDRDRDGMRPPATQPAPGAGMIPTPPPPPPALPQSQP